MADLTLVNANVLTMDPDPLARPRAGAVAITGGRIEAVAADAAGLGASQAGASQAGPGRVVDLRGATVMPGFHDAHNHMIGFGMSLAEVDLGSPPIGSLDELYAAIAERAASTALGDWVVGSGYDQTKLGAHPHRDALDRAAPGRRVWLRHTSGHMCVVNGLSWRTWGWTPRPRRCPAAGSAPTRTGGPTVCSRSEPRCWPGRWCTPIRWPS